MIHGGKFHSRLDAVIYIFDDDRATYNENTGASVRLFELNPNVLTRIDEFKAALSMEFEGGAEELTEEEMRLLTEICAVILQENSRGEVFSTWFPSTKKANLTFKTLARNWGEG